MNHFSNSFETHKRHKAKLKNREKMQKYQQKIKAQDPSTFKQKKNEAVEFPMTNNFHL